MPSKPHLNIYTKKYKSDRSKKYALSQLSTYDQYKLQTKEDSK